MAVAEHPQSVAVVVPLVVAVWLAFLHGAEVLEQREAAAHLQSLAAAGLLLAVAVSQVSAQSESVAVAGLLLVVVV